MDPGSIEGMISALRAAAELAPDNADLRAHVVRALLQANRPDQAEAEARAALSRMPGTPSMMLGLAAAFDAQGRSAEAIVTIEGVPVEARDAESHARHARLLLASGDPPAAADAYRLAKAVDPTRQDAALEALLASSSEPMPFEDEADESDEPVLLHAGGPEDVHGSPVVPLERPGIDFRHVGGLEPVKDEIRIKIIAPINHPELFAAYGKQAGGGVLLFGPPGCGKTHLARATAGEVELPFISVGIDDILDPYLGVSERQLAAIFEFARRNRPCVLFFDEVDALAADRRDVRASAGRTLVNQLLAELDGVEADNEGLLILAATNGPWYLDPAFRRPGRFDRQVFVPPPDEPARLAILEILIANRPRAEGLDLSKVAAATPDFSGADLREVVDRATEDKLRDALRTGAPQPIETSDLLAATKVTRPSTADWFASARNHVLHANQSGQWDDVARYLGIG